MLKLVPLLICVLFATSSYSAPSAVEKKRAKFGKLLKKTKRSYRRGELSDRAFWARLSKLYKYVRSGIVAHPSDLLQNQAMLLEKAGYPLLAAKYASKAIMASNKPYGREVRPAWKLLSNIAKSRQIHDILIDLATKITPGRKPPPEFGGSWNYFVAEAYVRKNNFKKAEKAFKRVQVKDRYWMAARYQLAMNYISNNNLNLARKTLSQLLDPDYNRSASISRYKRRMFIDSGFLALARVEYERKSYLDSIRFYRQINQKSPLFYEALFEQSWAFFMNGNPNHALGALHSTESPFFNDRFNPEVSILRSFIYYWMCRYDDARISLAGFIETYQEPVSKLDTFLKKKNFTPKTAFTLFENLIAGVSEKSLGISRRLLESVALNSEMRFVRDRLATVMEEKQRLELRGIFRSKKHTNRVMTSLEEWTYALTAELGEVYINEMEDLRASYVELRSQANFLHIELLMSEKEQALGRELHADKKLADVDLTRKVSGWGKGNQAWKASKLGEYWEDELGYYVYQVQPQCKGQ